MPARFPASAHCARAHACLTSPFLRRRSPLAAALSLAVALAWPASSAIAQTTDDAAAKAKQLDTVNVTGTRIDDVEGGRVGTKMDVPLRETPQSVSVVTRDQMDRRGVQTVEEALRYSAGTSLPYGYDQRYDWIDVRGFQTINDLFRDGLSLQGGTFNLPRFEQYAIERIEVLKGPAGVMYGAGNPGGLINLVSKRPREGASNEVAVTLGEHDRRELRTDLNGALGVGSGWLYRVVALASESDTEVDYNFSKRWLLMPSLQWSNDTTTIDLQATWQKGESRQGNAPVVAPYLRDVLQSGFGITLDIPRSRFIGEPGYDRFNPEYRTFGWSFEHRFNDVLSLRQNARYNRSDLDYRSTYLNGLDFNDPTQITRANLAVDEVSKGVVVDTALEAKFGGARVEHTVLAGVDYRRVDNDENDGFGAGSNLSLLDPVYGQPFVEPTQNLTTTKASQVGYYVQDHIKFDDRWVLLLGGRYDVAKTDSDSAFGASRFDDEAFTGRAGLVYVGEGGFAPYVSYSESFQPLNSTNVLTGEPFEPETGRQIEIGTRWQPVGSDVLISAAIFDIRKQNILIGDPNNQNIKNQVGEVRSRGFEAEVNTQIAPGTRLSSAFTYLDTDTLEGDALQPTGAPLPRVPKQSVSAYIDYTFAEGAPRGLNVGAGVRYVGTSTAVDSAFLTTGERLDVETPSYTVLDASVQYPWQNWTFSLTGSNLADREYEISCTAQTCYRGYGRRVNLSASYRW